jgi:DNA-binding beta-propeller fold protein YncE
MRRIRTISRRTFLCSGFLCVLLALPVGAWATQSVPILGGANSLVLDSIGAFAYASTGTTVLKVDVASRQVVQQFSYNIDSYGNKLGDIDESDSILSLTGFYSAGILSLGTGMQTKVLSGSSLYGSVLVNGVLYAPDFNNRGIDVGALDGSFTKIIKPDLPPGAVAGPDGIARTQDRQLIVVSDEFQDAFHLIDPTTQSVVETVPVGVDPELFALTDNDHALVVTRDDGTVAFIDFTHPNDFPALIRIPSLANVEALATNPARNQLLIAHQVPLDPTVLACPDPYGDMPSQPEIVVLDTQTKQVTERFRLDAIGKFQIGSIYANAMKVTTDGSTLLIASDGVLYFVDLTSRCRVGKLFKGRFQNSPYYCFR